jgi:hypothetical protein
MPTFIDESGDTGHGRGSKPYFRLAAVWLPTLNDAEAFRESVRRLRRDLGRKATYEFKFTKTHTYPEGRRRFFQIALASPFRFTVCCIDKTAAYWRRAPSQEQHWAAAVSLAVSLRPIYHATERVDSPLRDPILVDQNQDYGFLGEVQKAFHGLRSVLHPDIPLTENPRFRKSHPDEVMQLVDMVCGAVGASLDGNPEWYNIIRDRCLGVIRLP